MPLSLVKSEDEQYKSMILELLEENLNAPTKLQCTILFYIAMVFNVQPRNCVTGNSIMREYVYMPISSLILIGIWQYFD